MINEILVFLFTLYSSLRPNFMEIRLKVSIRDLMKLAKTIFISFASFLVNCFTTRSGGLNTTILSTVKVEPQFETELAIE